MNQLITIVAMIVVLIGLNGMSVSAVNVDVDGYKMISNVGDGLSYEYKVTSIEGNEVHGIALNRVSEGNAGIFLYADELTFDANVGDVISVVWGQYEDEFVSIELVNAVD